MKMLSRTARRDQSRTTAGQQGKRPCRPVLEQLEERTLLDGDPFHVTPGPGMIPAGAVLGDAGSFDTRTQHLLPGTHIGLDSGQQLAANSLRQQIPDLM